MNRLAQLERTLKELLSARGCKEVETTPFFPYWPDLQPPFAADEPCGIAIDAWRSYRTGWLGLRHTPVPVRITLRLLGDGNITISRLDVKEPPRWAVGYGQLKVLSGERFLELTEKRLSGVGDAKVTDDMLVVNTSRELLDILRSYDQLAREIGGVTVFTA